VKAGLGYALHVDRDATEMVVGRLTKSRGELHGMLRVQSALPAVRSVDGTLFSARANLSSDTARKTIAKALNERAPAAGIDWLLLLDEFCTRVLAAEQAGEPVIMVGALPRPVGIIWRLEPLLPAGKPVVLYGEGGTGKSTLAAMVAVSVETGVTIVDGFIPHQAPVLYLDWEADRDEINDRIRGVAIGANIPHVVQVRYRGCAGPLADQAEEIAGLVAEIGAGLVIVDSIGLAAGTSSDGADAAESALRMFSAFRLISSARAGCSVLAIDHVSKNETEQTHRAARPYGSIYKVNLARAMFEVRRLEDEREASSTIGLYNTKSNVRALIPPIALRLDYDEGGEIRYERLAEMPTTAAEGEVADVIAAYLAAGPRTVREIAKHVKRTDGVVRSILNRFRDDKPNPRFRNTGVMGWMILEEARDATA
jgi:hypothetical protein